MVFLIPHSIILLNKKFPSKKKQITLINPFFTMPIKEKFTIARKWIWKYKYLWTLVLFALIMGVLDTNSLWRRYNIRKENQALREEIQSLQEKFEADKRELRALQNDPEVVEEVARMRFFMKTPDEDVYIIE
jgi:cell division protein FtsB